MLDVHVPHPTHTWKDFLIHIATISVGLLIAISLEQTVEYLHREHQAHKLEEDLHLEGLESRQIARLDIENLDDFMSVLAEQVRLTDVELAMRTHRSPRFSGVEVRQPSGTFIMPPAAVWTSARESKLTELLPRELHRSYTRLYLQFDLAQRYELDRRDADYDLEAFDCRFGNGTLPCKPELAAMSTEELKERQSLLMKAFTRTQAVKSRFLAITNFNEAILAGQTITGLETDTLKSFKLLREQFGDKFLAPASPATKP